MASSYAEPVAMRDLNTVRESLDLIEKSTWAMESTMSDLEARINGPVPHGVTVAEDDPKMPPPYVGVQTHAANNHAALQRLHERMLNLLNRI